LPDVDVLIDLHSGGRSLLYTPLAATHVIGDAERDRRAIAALKAFGAPIGLIARDIDSHGLLDYTAEAMGKLVISTELGGGAMVSPAAVEVGRRGVRALLGHLGVIEDAEVPSQTRLMETPSLACFAMVRGSGIYQPVFDLGDRVETGETLGFLHDLDFPGESPRAVTAKVSGTLVCRRAQGHTRTGDCVAILGQDLLG
jgi:N-alpha-acetyl-L-2,4-diaminobutyrate deacetylase